MTRATEKDYEVLFNSPSGALVLEDLMARFDQQTYVRGGLEAQRETDFRAGSREVIQHILRKMSADQGAEPQQED